MASIHTDEPVADYVKNGLTVNVTERNGVRDMQWRGRFTKGECWCRGTSVDILPPYGVFAETDDVKGYITTHTDYQLSTAMMRYTERIDTADGRFESAPIRCSELAPVITWLESGPVSVQDAVTLADGETLQRVDSERLATLWYTTEHRHHEDDVYMDLRVISGALRDAVGRGWRGYISYCMLPYIQKFGVLRESTAGDVVAELKRVLKFGLANNVRFEWI